MTRSIGLRLLTGIGTRGLERLRRDQVGRASRRGEPVAESRAASLSRAGHRACLRRWAGAGARRR